MTKEEFLNTLRTSLLEKISASELEDTIHYYDEYITEKIRNGKTEQEVLEELGSPLLISRTIVDTAGTEMEDHANRYSHSSGESEDRREESMIFKHYHVNPWVSKLSIVAIVAVIVLLLITILRVLLPIAVPLIIIGFLISMFRKGGQK